MDLVEEDEGWTMELLSIAGSTPALFPWSTLLNDEKDATNEVIETIRLVCQDERETVPQLAQELDRILRDSDTKSCQSMKQVCDRYNRVVDEILSQDPEVPRRLRRRPSVSLLRHIIQQCYNRAVVDPEKLNQYEPFSAGVYGETSFELIDQMINTINLTENDVFIDLGSGVGQVVLQVAAATGCKSCIGIEKANWPAQYAEQMTYEFRRWMKFYGKTFSNFELFKGDFLSDKHRTTINSSTVIFVNNFAFGPEVDLQLKERFHDLKEGSKIVSSREFRPMNMQISERNLSDIGAILTVQELSPLRGPVSWTHKPVSYFLHTIDRTQLENFYFSRRNGVKLIEQPKRDVSKGKILTATQDCLNSKIIPRRPRLAQRKKPVHYRLPLRSHDRLKPLPDSDQSPLKFVGMMQVPGTTFMQGAEAHRRIEMQAMQSLRFNDTDLPPKRNGVHPCVKTGTETTTVSRDRLEKHIQRLKSSTCVSSGIAETQAASLFEKNLSTDAGAERFGRGKRRQRSDETPEPKRQKVISAKDTEPIPTSENVLALDLQTNVPTTRLSADALRNVQSVYNAASSGGRAGNAGEMPDVGTLRSLLVTDGALTEKNETEIPRNVGEARQKKTRTVGGKRHRSILPLSDINGNRQGERSACETNQVERPSCKSSNRWLFDIRLVPSPLTKVDPQINLAAAEPTDSSAPGKDRVSEMENGRNLPLPRVCHRSKLNRNRRIDIDSHPNHANRGFVRGKNGCKSRVQSGDLNVAVTSNDEAFCLSNEVEQPLQLDNRIQRYFNLNTAHERKMAKKTSGDGACGGAPLASSRALLSNLEESLWEPCWTEDENEPEELDEALEMLHQETDVVTKTGLGNSDRFNVDWMTRNARNICRTIPLLETEPISGSSDVSNPPEFFPPNGATAVASWLQNYLKHDDESDCKPLAWCPTLTEQDAVSTHGPIFVSLPRDVLHKKYDDTSANDPTTSVPSIPISFPREAAMFGVKSPSSPDLPFGPKPQANAGSVLSPVSSDGRTIMPGGISLSKPDELEKGIWDLPRIPVSLPKEALMAKQESDVVVGKNEASDGIDSRSCSSYTGSTMSYDDSLPVESHVSFVAQDIEETKHEPPSVDESDVPPELQRLLDTFKSLYMTFLKHQKSPSYHEEIAAKIDSEKSRKEAAISLEKELTHQISRLEEENAFLLQMRLSEFKRYEEFCQSQLAPPPLPRDLSRRSSMLSGSSLKTLDGNSPSLNIHSVGNSPQILDVALIESNLTDPSPDDALSDPSDPSEACDIMPKLNLSVDYTKEDEDQTAGDEVRSRSCTVSPEPDMPLLMPELDPSTRDSPPTETRSSSSEEALLLSCTMSIPVKLPLKKLLRSKKPANLSLTIPTSETNSLPLQADALLTRSPVPSSPKCRPLESDRLNMYSPISRASSVENVAAIDDLEAVPGKDPLPCFSPISSPGSVRSAVSERLGFSNENDGYAPPHVETAPVKSFGADYPQWSHFDRWGPIPLVAADTKFPWQNVGPPESNSSNPDVSKIVGGSSSAEELGSLCSRLATQKSPGQMEYSRGEIFHQEDLASCESRIRRSDDRDSLRSNFERCTSAPLGDETAKSTLEEAKDRAGAQSRPQRRERNRTAVLKPLGTPENDVAAAVCRRLGQSSPRCQVSDLSRQMDSRSDSRDSGLGKESEIDYDRLLSLRNGHALSGALDSGVSSPRISVNRVPQFPHPHPLTMLAVDGSFAWRSGLQPENPSDECINDIFGGKSFDKGCIVDNFTKDANCLPLPPLAFRDGSPPASLTCGQSSDRSQLNNYTLPDFRLSQNEMFDFRERNDDLSRYLGSNCIGNYMQAPDFSVSNRSKNWVNDTASTVAMPTGGVRRNPKSQVSDFSASKDRHRARGKPSGVEHYPNSKLYDATAWPSYLSQPSQECYGEKRRFADCEDLSQERLQNPCLAPNSRLGLEPSFPSPYHQTSRGFVQDAQFNAYPTHYFGGAPAFHGVSSNHRSRRKMPPGVGFPPNRFADRTFGCNPADELFFQPPGSALKSSSFF